MEIPSLSDTRWVWRLAAIQLFLNRFECIILALETIIDDYTDIAKASEAVGLSVYLQEFAFLFFCKCLNMFLA